MLILASGSPRRKELLKKIVKDYTVIVPNIDERILDLDPKDLPAEESKEKAYAIHAKYPDDAVLACDTIVVLEGEVLGKPKDEADAIKMLQEAIGQTPGCSFGLHLYRPVKKKSPENRDDLCLLSMSLAMNSSPNT
jgi:septum formation protein